MDVGDPTDSSHCVTLSQNRIQHLSGFDSETGRSVAFRSSSDGSTNVSKHNHRHVEQLLPILLKTMSAFYLFE
jgi:hypothetical protein